MGLFGRKKKTCCCENAAACGGAGDADARILVLGSGCSRCQTLEDEVRAVLEELGQEPRVGHVQDLAQIAAYGVMSTPALVIDGRVVTAGRIPDRAELRSLLGGEADR